MFSTTNHFFNIRLGLKQLVHFQICWRGNLNFEYKEIHYIGQSTVPHSQSLDVLSPPIVTSIVCNSQQRIDMSHILLLTDDNQLECLVFIFEVIITAAG